MCGVLGLAINDFSEEPHGDLVRNLFKESMIRGKHATGVSYVKNDKVVTISEPIPADEFISKQDINSWVNEDGNLYCIGHIRYSTSDLRFNQPMASDELAIVHNGVITQEPHYHWFFQFDVPLVCKTQNDSEMILRAMEEGYDPLTLFHPASMAVCAVNTKKQLVAFRNEARPLYYTHAKDGVIFASTGDILKRAGLKFSVKTPPYEVFIVDGFKVSGYTVPNQLEDLQ